MGRFLLIDVGAGTMDILFVDEDADLVYKAVAKSPVRELAEQAEALTGNLLVTGCEMGGGAISNVLKRRARKFEVTMSVSAAKTIHHDLEKVRAFGINVVEDDHAEALRNDPRYESLILSDLPADRLKGIVKGLGVPFSFDIIGVCVQDHGVAGPGISHLDFRHQIFKDALNEHPFPHALLYPAGRVPAVLSRLTSAAKRATELPTREVYVMDSGMAAILGACMDGTARNADRIMVLDVATSHTLGAALMGDQIAGFFEYHTRDITLDRLEKLLPDLANGNLSHRQILAEGGHGAYMRMSLGFDGVESIIATGPKRGLLKGSRLPMVWGAPFGDNMMTGTVGLLEAIRRHKGLGPKTYL